MAAHTPTWPENLAYPTASNAAISSWRAWTNAGWFPAPPPRGQQPIDPIPGIREHTFDAPLPQAGQQHIADSIGHFIYSLRIADSLTRPYPTATNERESSFSRPIRGCA